MDPVLENVLVEVLVELPADADVPIVASAPERTWIWSDLHLSDPSVLLGRGRPFRSVEEMNRHLLRNWRRRVGADDTIICLGDVGHPDAWRDDGLMLDVSECPGERLLVLGNHDVDPVNRIRPFGIDHTAGTLYAASDPPRLLTHMPLLQVPHGAVNVHGHVHEQESPTPNRHVNVSVEQLNYQPANLSDIRRLARRLMEGRTVPGQSTRARLRVVEGRMP